MLFILKICPTNEVNFGNDSAVVVVINNLDLIAEFILDWFKQSLTLKL